MQTHIFIYPENPLLTWLFEAERAHTSDDKLLRVLWYLSREKGRLVLTEDASEHDRPPVHNRVKFCERVY